ncbi:hypothetical protein BT93_L1550 [Corymbia citriodora subsp. variegata]|uniref:Peptidase A1 domain-containing protein n=1 Tax=Corymbia citriodora subsp. variegata TaxID=360336 RepID=A0A8T0CNL4_CORYI|nr:hypothetical protein BT93_L1550 [Corymbia citriodora subsp. variegata]
MVIRLHNMAASCLHSCIKTLLFVSLLSLVNEGYAQREQSKSESRHIFQVSSLLPSASCKTSSTGNIQKSSLKVVHKHGPCSLHAQAKPNLLNHTKILVGDQSRVDSIQSKISTSLGGSKATLPATLGIPFESAEYVVTIGIGSPPLNLTLIFDTGSDLTWTQCEPCSFCYPQSDPIFDPSHSSSYAATPCTSPMCTASDTLTLTSTDVIRNFQFGCGKTNYGQYGEVAGLLGLARDSLSIVGQTTNQYGQYFSYCLPSSSSSTGYLTFGKTSESPKSLTFTPMANIPGSSYFYGINIVGIAVGGTTLPIPSPVFTNAGAIIDSGTVITRLPPTAYNALSTAFQKEMASYKRAAGFGIFDTCYDLSNTTSIVVPNITFTFSGGAFMDLDSSGILYTITDAQVCLAFAPNDEDTEIVIYGNTQQKTFEVIYDVARGQLGFAPNSCS